MNRARTLPFVLVLLALSPLAAAQESRDPARLFPREASVSHTYASGLARLTLPAEVIAASRPDLSDVRLHRGDGSEVPYLVDSGVRPSSRAQVYTLTPRAIERRVTTTPGAPARSFERFELLPPTSAREDARWTLRIDARAQDFVRAVRVVRADGSVLAEGSVFRLRAPLRERLSLDVPSQAAPDVVYVELSGDGAHLEPTFEFVETAVPAGVARLEVPLEERARRTADGRTVVELARPGGITPDRLRLVTTGAHFARTLRVLDVPAGQAGREVGSGTLFRVRELGVEELELAVGPVSGEVLRVELEDGDAGVLEGLSFIAIVRQPALVFDASEATGLMLRFGGGRARAPRYDLASLRWSRIGVELVEREHPPATLGPIRANPAFDEGPALAFAMRPGRAPELARFRHVATLRVAGAREGASRVRLPPAVQALAREDLADVRVVDAEGRQWPYLVLPGPLADTVDAVLARPSARETSTVFAIRPPDGRARVERLQVDMSEPFVARSYTLSAVARDGSRSTLAEGELRREPDDLRPIEIAIVPQSVDALELVIEDGNDAPLRLTRVRLDVSSPTFFVAAPDGEYRLLFGDPRAEPPEYELARAESLVLSVLAADATVGAPASNPAFVEPPWYGAADGQSLALWGVLIFAVLVLGLLTLRLTTRAPSPPPPPAGGPPSDDAPPSSGPPSDEPPSDEPAAGESPAAEERPAAPA